MLYVKFLNWENGSEDKVLAVKPEDLSSILGSTELKNQVSHAVLWLPYISYSTKTPTPE